MRTLCSRHGIQQKEKVPHGACLNEGKRGRGQGLHNFFRQGTRIDCAKKTECDADEADQRLFNQANVNKLKPILFAQTNHIQIISNAI